MSADLATLQAAACYLAASLLQVTFCRVLPSVSGEGSAVINEKRAAAGFAIDDPKAPWNDIRLSNDWTFCKALEDERLCRKLVGEILGREVESVESILPHRNLQTSTLGKGVQIDIYVRDSEGNVFDIEMQMVSRGDLPRRVRYYHSMIDIDNAHKGMLYTDLPDTYVVFFCMEDPFGLGLRRYTFLPHCQENGTLSLDDGLHTVFYYCRGEHGDVGEQMAVFLRYVSGTIDRNEQLGNGTLAAEADRAVRRLRRDEEWRMNLMFGYVHEQDIRDEGREEGRTELTSRLKKLREALDAAGRSSEFADAATDPELFSKLCKEFGIS